MGQGEPLRCMLAWHDDAVSSFVLSRQPMSVYKFYNREANVTQIFSLHRRRMTFSSNHARTWPILNLLLITGTAVTIMVAYTSETELTSEELIGTPIVAMIRFSLYQERSLSN